jgi:alcohol dehydrogenase (cytochrome c)
MASALKPIVAVAIAAIMSGQPAGQSAVINATDLLAGLNNPSRWLTYSGNYASHRHSPLTRITPDNVGDLEALWTFQTGVIAGGNAVNKFEATPIVIDGTLYVTGMHNNAWAVDGRTGKQLWRYQRQLPPGLKVCCGPGNRGFAVHGDRLFMTTLDAHVIALDRHSGKVVWDVSMAEHTLGYASTVAPLVVKDKLIVGMAGGEFATRGFLDAYDMNDGARLWRFYTIPAPGEPGGDSWPPGHYERGGGATWITGSYDPELNLVYWGTGNPNPDFYGGNRQGDNLYTDSVVALDADSGRLRWHFQYTPHDEHDWDANQIQVLADLTINGRPRKALVTANRNGFFYVLDRTTGKFLHGSPFVKVNWASGLDENGRPIQTPQPTGQPTWPGNQGGTNWYSPSFSPRTGLFYVSVWEGYASVYRKEQIEYVPGRNFGGGGHTVVTPVPGAPAVRIGRATPINNWTDAVGHGVTMAIDPATGKEKWRFNQFDVTDSGILTTATDLLFTGGREGYFYALDARSGELLWKTSLGGQIVMGPISYAIEGKQYVSVVSGNSLVTFALRD